MSKLTKAIDTIKDQTWPGLRHASIGDTIDAISRSGEWTAFEAEEDNDDGFTAIREGNIIVDFSGKDNNGDKVNIQWACLFMIATAGPKHCTTVKWVRQSRACSGFA